MAIDLLCDDYWQGKIARLYRHDLEGLIWVLPWAFLQYEGSKTGLQLSAWCTGDYNICCEKKTRLLHQRGYVPTKSWEAEWGIAQSLLLWLVAEMLDRVRAKPGAEESPASLKESLAVYNRFSDTLRHGWETYAPLDSQLFQRLAAPSWQHSLSMYMYSIQGTPAPSSHSFPGVEIWYAKETENSRN
jgi:hypothetical protein